MKAMGNLVEKRVAQTLVDFLRNEPDVPQIQNAAKTALVELTGLQRLSGDRERLIRWWDLNKNTPDAQWKEECHVRQADNAAAVQKDKDVIVEAMRQWVQDDYNANPDPKKLDKLLSNRAAPMRLIGVDLAQGDWDKTGRIAPVVTTKLREMIGDSAIEVRQGVVRTLRITLAGSDDAKAKTAMVDALMTQLAIEKDSEVKAGIAAALGQFRDPRAITPLLAALNDEAARVQEAAAAAIKELGPLIVAAKDPVLSARVRDVLRARLNDAPKASAVRSRIVEAMSALQDTALLNDFYGLLNMTEHVLVRRAAIVGLAGIRNPAAANIVARWVSSDRGNAGVRLEAASAMSKLGTFDDISPLVDRLNPAVEEDKSVRDAIWRTILVLAEKGSPADLNGLANKLANSEQRLEILKLEEGKLTALNSPAELAACRENLAQTLMDHSRPQEAAGYYVKALDFWISKNDAPRLDALVRPAADAFLQGGDYAGAMQFAVTRIKGNRSYLPTMLNRIFDEVERLHKAKEYKKALDLLDEAAKVGDSLGDSGKQQLEAMRDKVKRWQQNGGLFWWPGVDDALAGRGGESGCSHDLI